MAIIESRRTCVVCGKKYKTCKTCDKLAQAGTFTWRGSCDTQDCFMVLMILNGYFYKEYTKDEAKELLDEYLTEYMKPYTDNTKNMIEEIYHNDDKSFENQDESTIQPNESENG